MQTSARGRKRSLQAICLVRSIDDILMVRTEGEDNLKTFINYINYIHPTIKFTHECSNSSNQTLPTLDSDKYTSATTKSRPISTPQTSINVFLKLPATLLIRLALPHLLHFGTTRTESPLSYKGRQARRHHSTKLEIKPQPQNNSDRTPFVIMITFIPALLNASFIVRRHINILTVLYSLQATSLLNLRDLLVRTKNLWHL